MEPLSEDIAPVLSAERSIDPTTKDIPEADVAPATQLPTTVQQLTDQTLSFLSTASNETLGACLVGLGATTYLVLGRVGLVIIGVVGGVVLHATWEGNPQDGPQAGEERKRREAGIDVVQRVLEWRTQRNETMQDDEDDASTSKVELHSKKKSDFSGFQPETQEALNEFTEAIIRDYVKWWYSPIIPTEMAFPNAARNTLVAFLLSLSGHLSRKRPADTFLDFLTNSSSIVIVFLNEIASAIAASPNSSCAEAVGTYLDLKPDSNLAHVLDTKHQSKKLDLVAQDILECYLEPKSLNCEPVKTFCQHILSEVILEMTIASCSRPEFINGWIVYLLEDGEPELLKEVDAGLEGITTEKSILPSLAEADNPKDRPDHKRTLSRAQEAMDDAMQEAQRLSELIAEDDARRTREQSTNVIAAPASGSGESNAKVAQNTPSSGKTTPYSSSIMTDDMSESTTQGIATPTSSQSEPHGEEEQRLSRDNLSLASSPEQAERRAASQEPTTAVPFVSFDQLAPQHLGTEPETPKREIPPLTLHNANISIFDDTDPNERSTLRTKPIVDYLIQIEPPSSHYSGWMIVRKYADFETMHEILRRIAPISGAGDFTRAHATLPNFKAHTKASLREALERYITDAVRYKPLAESEGMKRFLERERGMEKSPNPKTGFGWPTPTAFESMGKGMMDVLTKAPKDVAGGGKSFIGGVGGVLGNKKKKQSVSSPAPSRNSVSSPPGPSREKSSLSSISQNSVPRESQESLKSASPMVDTQPTPVPQMERSPLPKPEVETEFKPRPSMSTTSRSIPARHSMESMAALGADQHITLPPPPSDIPDDYNPMIPTTTTEPSRSEKDTPTRTSTSTIASSLESSLPKAEQTPAAKGKAKAKLPITEQETQVAVELLFATIQELYTLSSAWTLRRTLLMAAKTFLLRPGNPQLESIRQLLQTTVLDANTSDTGIATHLTKMRLNALPTEEELKAWPPEINDKEKEELRVKARKLLVERGMPQALTSVMGQAASGEALGKIFDCLQLSNVARGLTFGLILQGLRTVTQ